MKKLTPQEAIEHCRKAGWRDVRICATHRDLSVAIGHDGGYAKLYYFIPVNKKPVDNFASQ